MKCNNSVIAVKLKRYEGIKFNADEEFNEEFQLSLKCFSSLRIVTCVFHTQNKMIYLPPGDNHIALEIEN